MLKLTLDDIHIGLSPKDKQQVIGEVAQALTNAGYTDADYIKGMLAREELSSTYLGNGIAIPHGTPETRHYVKKTGIQIFQFPNGVRWGYDGELAYVVIGIAASSDEHLTLLRQLTHVLDKPGLDKKLANIQSAQALLNLLSKEEKTTELLFNETLISLDMPIDDLVTLQAINAAKLQQMQAVNSDFVSESIEPNVVALADNIWLSDGQHGALQNAIAIVRSQTNDKHQAKLLLTIAIDDNERMHSFLNQLAHLILTKQIKELLTADATTLIDLLSVKMATETESETILPKDALSAEFTVLNPHGLHTRPSSLLVKLIKSFNSTITVANLDGQNKAVKGTNLMKLVSLGAKKGSRLRFTAQGEDAQQALDAIGKAMAEGLGENIE